MDNKKIIAGIGVGPMTDKYEIKILICYLLNSVNIPLSKGQLNDIFQSGEYVNYFNFCIALKELLEGGHISAKKVEFDEIYTLQELGIETSNKLERSLPKSLRDNVVVAAIELIAKIKKERENEVTIVPYQNGFMVNCVMHDDNFDLLKFSLYMADIMQAQKIEEKFLKDPVSFYRSIIRLLIGDI